MVGIIASKHLKDYIVAVKRIVDWILLIKLVIGDNIINVISAYASQVGLDDHTKSNFWIIWMK